MDLQQNVNFVIHMLFTNMLEGKILPNELEILIISLATGKIHVTYITCVIENVLAQKYF